MRLELVRKEMLEYFWTEHRIFSKDILSILIDMVPLPGPVVLPRPSSGDTHHLRCLPRRRVQHQRGHRRRRRRRARGRRRRRRRMGLLPQQQRRHHRGAAAAGVQEVQRGGDGRGGGGDGAGGRQGRERLREPGGVRRDHEERRVVLRLGEAVDGRSMPTRWCR